MGQYLPVVVLAVLTAAFGALNIVVSRVMNPPRPTAAQVAPYESGIVDQAPPPERFPVKFYLIAMIFIVFDIEIIFLFPFTTVFRELGVFGLVAIAIFAAAVFESFVYLIANGALDWGPLKRVRHSAMVDRSRTLRSTVRRVGTEGRATGSIIATPLHDEPVVAHHGGEEAG